MITSSPPNKGDVETWYIRNQGLKKYFLLIFVTVWVVLFPDSQIVRSMFSNLPAPPSALLRRFANSGDTGYTIVCDFPHIVPGAVLYGNVKVLAVSL